MRGADPETETDAASGRDVSTWLLPVLLVAAAVATYANGLSGPFVFDDVGAIVENPHVRRLWPLSEALSAPPQATVAGRPVVSLSLALNYAAGGLDVRGYHVVNIAIHVLCGLLLYGIVRHTLAGPVFAPPLRSRARGFAAACALLWLVHPLCTETVNYVVQRTESLMALFYLGTLYCAARAATSDRPGSWSVCAVLACAAGMGSKEVMVTVPVAVLLYDVAYRRDSLRQTVGRRWPLYAGLAATWGILAAILASGPRSKTVGLTLGVSGLDYAKHQAVLVLGYLKTAVWPHPLVFDYGYARPFGEATVAPYAVTIVVLAMLAVLAWWRRPWLGYPGVWFFLVLAPTSSFVPIVSEVGAERRMYLPLAGLIVLFLALALSLLVRLPRRTASVRGPVALVTVLVVAGALGWTTRARNSDYRSAEILWRTAVVARPQNPRAHNNLAQSIHLQGRPREAIPYYRRALDLDGQYSQAWFNLGVALADLGRSDEALEQYRRALELNPELARAHHNLGAELANRGRLTEALRHFREAVRHAPEWAPARHKLGRALWLTGEGKEALTELERAIRLDPDSWEALDDLAWIRATAPDPNLRDPQEAVRRALCAAALTDRRRATTLDTLAAAYAAAGRFEEAATTAREAIEVANAAGAQGLGREIAARLALYESGEAYREEIPPSR